MKMHAYRYTVFAQLQVGHVGNEECQWYEDVNEVEKHLVFRCPRRQYMAGIKSSFTASASDRV